MAKVGFWLKGANGKFAGATIFKSNGVTQIREVVAPKNPRTSRQMSRRSTFLCPVKFFARAQQNFFPFAYEDKKQGWSEFNAFMHHNANNGVYMTPAMAKCPTYPCFGNWQMTQGSLPQILLKGDNNWGYQLIVPGQDGSDLNTVGGLSTALINSYNLREGDIITMVQVYSAADYSWPTIAPEYDPLQPVHWEMTSFRIDSSSVVPVNWPGTIRFGRQSNEVINLLAEDCNISALCIVASRTSGSGTKVSTSFLVPDTITQQAIDAHRTEAFHQRVLDEWGALPAAVLQGGLLDPSGVAGYFNGPIWWFPNQSDFGVGLLDPSGEEIQVTSSNNLKLLLSDGSVYNANDTDWCRVEGVQFLVFVNKDENTIVFRRQDPSPEKKLSDGAIRAIIYNNQVFAYRPGE